MKITDEILTQYLEGELQEEDNRKVEEALKADTDVKARKEQLEFLLSAMAESIEYEEDLKNINPILISNERQYFQNPFIQIAAAVTLVLLGFFGGRISEGPNQQLVALNNEVAQLRQSVMMTMLENHSASDRLKAVSLIEAENAEENELLAQTLLKTLTQDDSPNVRYAAVQALSRYIDNPNIRMSLVKSLEDQTDPLIQIALINLLVDANEKATIAPLKKILKNEHSSPEVKRQSEIALQVLI